MANESMRKILIGLITDKNFVKEYITIDSHNQKQALAEAIKVASVVEPDAKIVDTSKTKNYYDK